MSAFQMTQYENILSIARFCAYVLYSLACHICSCRNKQEELKDVKEKQRAELLSKMPNFPLESTITVDGSNLADYFYLACGEEDDLDAVRGRERKASVAKASASREGRSADSNAAAAGEDAAAEAEAGRNAARRMVELESHCRVRCKIKFGGFHPPPAHRRIHGDLAYLEVTLPGASEDVVHVTAVPAGFYVNKTTIAPDGYSEPYVFDPRPADNACYSHELLDCLLQYSKSLRSAWVSRCYHAHIMPESIYRKSLLKFCRLCPESGMIS